ncbi:MAG TPA: hypothetical protein VJ548_16080 [Azospira sp.]|nr:hypothetical protein [Azospira sp.]
MAESRIPDYIGLSERVTLEAWLDANPKLRVATDEDCNCTEDIASVRKGDGGVWKPKPSFHPYYVSGDFNDDKIIDFAVVLIERETRKRFLAIFNNPYARHAKPAYFAEADVVLFFGPPRPKPYRLIVGDFWSEGESLEPKGKTYVRVGGDY